MYSFVGGITQVITLSSFCLFFKSRRSRQDNNYRNGGNGGGGGGGSRAGRGNTPNRNSNRGGGGGRNGSGDRDRDRDRRATSGNRSQRGVIPAQMPPKVTFEDPFDFEKSNEELKTAMEKLKISKYSFVVSSVYLLVFLIDLICAVLLFILSR